MSNAKFLRGTEIPIEGIPDVDGKPFSEVWEDYFELYFKAEENGFSAPEVNLQSLLSRPIEEYYSTSGLMSVKDYEHNYGVKLFRLRPETKYLLYINTSESGSEDIETHPDLIAIHENDEYSKEEYDVFFDSGITQEIGDEVSDSKEISAKINDLKFTFESIAKEKTRSPWSILFEGNQLGYFSKSMSKSGFIDSIRKDLAAYQKMDNQVKKVLKNVLADKPVSKKMFEEVSQTAYRYDRMLYITSYHIDEIISRPSILEGLENVKAMIKEAEALPEDSPLRKHLLDDRGTSSYMTTEGKGRNKRSVRKTFELGSVMGKMLQEEERKLTSNDSYRAKVIEFLEKVIAHTEGSVASSKKKFEEAMSAHREAFKIAWPGSEDEFDLWYEKNYPKAN